MPVPHPSAPALRMLVLLLAAGAAGPVAAQRAYHLDPSGSDAAGDGSRARPWATLARAAALDLEPGDSLLLRGGARFEGQVTLDATDAGTPARPVVVGSYGDGHAVVAAPPDDYGVYVYNAAGVRVERLTVVGSGGSGHPKDGVMFYADLPGDVRLRHVRIDSVDVSGFHSGFSVGGWNGRAGFDDVRVTASAFHHNVSGGGTYAERVGGVTDVYVGDCRFFDNAGRPGHPSPTGSGLVLGGVRGGLVERSSAYRNGALNTSPAGPVGFWAYDADAVVFQHNEAWDNRTGPGGGDGGGFDLDGGVTNSVLQYNHSHDNDGAGFGLFQYAGAPRSGGNVVRHNLSERDGRKNGYGGISVWGASAADVVGPAEVYENTVRGGSGPAVLLMNAHHEGLTVRANRFDGASVVVRAPAPGGVRFAGNAYTAPAAPVEWDGATYATVAAWAAATGQESGPVPVELVAFTAQSDGPAVRLAWATASETANAGFHVEARAAADPAWRALAFVPGHGTTAERHAYAFDAALAPGVYRFRLRQVDLDGTATTSAEVEAAVAPRRSGLYPNPARARATFAYDGAAPAEATLHDARGRAVRALPVAPASTVGVDVAGLAPGAYVLVVRSRTGARPFPLTVVR